MKNNVYLIPCGDRAYYAQVSTNSSSPSAIFMVAEGNYPVEMWWSRHDLNMCRLWETETCNSREDLIDTLNFLGECGHNVETLWDYDDKTTTNAKIIELFDVCYERKREQICAAFDEATEALEASGEDMLPVFC